MLGQRGQRKRTERVPQGGLYQLQCFQNVWYECFFTHHNRTGKDDVPAVDDKKSLGGMGDKLAIFLQVADGLGSPCEADGVKRYCEGVSLEDVQDGVGEGGTRLAAWIDDRNSPHLTGSGNVRHCKNPLTATGLLRYLKKPVWIHLNWPPSIDQTNC